MKVLFLDIDGVLNSARSAVAFGGYPFTFAPDLAQFDVVAVRMISGIVRAAGAKVVLSSAWRNDRDEYPKAADALDLPIIDKTPTLWTRRGEEIAQWLAAHPEVEQYAIVDDDADMLPEQMPYFVRTDGHEGLSFANASKLAVLLGIDIHAAAPCRLREPAKTLRWTDGALEVEQ